MIGHKACREREEDLARQVRRLEFLYESSQDQKRKAYGDFISKSKSHDAAVSAWERKVERDSSRISQLVNQVHEYRDRNERQRATITEYREQLLDPGEASCLVSLKKENVELKEELGRANKGYDSLAADAILVTKKNQDNVSAIKSLKEVIRQRSVTVAQGREKLRACEATIKNLRDTHTEICNRNSDLVTKAIEHERQASLSRSSNVRLVKQRNDFKKSAECRLVEISKLRQKYEKLRDELALLKAARTISGTHRPFPSQQEAEKPICANCRHIRTNAWFSNSKVDVNTARCGHPDLEHVETVGCVTGEVHYRGPEPDEKHPLCLHANLGGQCDKFEKNQNG